MLSVDVISEKYGVEQAAVVLICRVFVGTASSQAQNTFLNEYSIDWWSLYRIIAKNKIRPVAYHVLQSVDVPTDVKQQLKRDSLLSPLDAYQGALSSQKEVLLILNRFHHR